MKKTLAAVLAAMMALSTATVALAKDTDVDGDTISGSFSTIEESTEPTAVEFGKTNKLALKVSGYVLDLGNALANDKIKIDVTVTEGRSLLAAAPTVKAMKDSAGDIYAVLNFKVKHTYGVNFYDTDDDDADGNPNEGSNGFTKENHTQKRTHRAGSVFNRICKGFFDETDSEEGACHGYDVTE